MQDMATAILRSTGIKSLELLIEDLLWDAEDSEQLIEALTNISKFEP